MGSERAKARGACTAATWAGAARVETAAAATAAADDKFAEDEEERDAAEEDGEGAWRAGGGASKWATG